MDVHLVQAQLWPCDDSRMRADLNLYTVEHDNQSIICALLY